MRGVFYKRTTQIVDDLNLLNILNKSTLNLCIIASKRIIGDITHDETKLSIKESIFIGSMLFGLFFGAGNLIFPIHLGQTGENVWLANLGF